jgi:hypothetical protein
MSNVLDFFFDISRSARCRNARVEVSLVPSPLDGFDRRMLGDYCFMPDDHWWASNIG